MGFTANIDLSRIHYTQIQLSPQILSHYIGIAVFIISARTLLVEEKGKVAPAMMIKVQ